MVSDILMLSIAIQGVNNFSTVFRQAKTEVTGLQGVFHGFSKALRAASGQIVMMGAYMANEFIRSSVDVATQYELSMTRVMAISGATASQFSVLNEKVKELGATTMFTRQEVSEGAKQMAMAGLSAQQIAAGLDSVVAISEVLGVDIGRAAEVLTDLGLAFKMNIENASAMERIADVMEATTTSAALSFEQLAGSMTYVSATASMVGVGLSEISAEMGAMANMGIKGTKAGTALNRALQSVILPSLKGQQAMERLGLEFNAVTLQSEGLIEVIRQLKESGASAADIFTMFGIRGGRSIAALVNTSTAELEALIKKIDESSGITKKHQKMIHETAAYTYKEWDAAIESTKGELGSFLNNGLVPLMKGLMSFGKAVSKEAKTLTILSTVMIGLIARHKILAGLKAAHMALSSGTIAIKLTEAKVNMVLAAAIKTNTTLTAADITMKIAEIGVIGTLKAALIALYGVMMSNPITMIIIGIGALIAGIVAWTMATDKAEKKQKSFGEKVAETAEKLVGQEDALYQTTEGIRGYGEVLGTHMNNLRAQKKELDENNSAQAVNIAIINKSISETKRMTSEVHSFAEGVHAILTEYKDYNKLTKESIITINDMIDTMSEAGVVLKKYMDDMINSSNSLAGWNEVISYNQTQLDANSASIEEYKLQIENLEYEFPVLTRNIQEFTWALEEMQGVMNVNSATIDLHQAKINLWSKQIEDAKQSFLDSDEAYASWGWSINNLTRQIEVAGEEISGYNRQIKQNNYSIGLLERTNEDIIASFGKERAEIQGVQDEINRLNGIMDRYSEKQNRNNIKIRKMRLQARKEGRDLTEEELAEIERMEISNEESAINQMELAENIKDAEEDKAAKQIELDEMIAAATKENTDLIKAMLDENEDYALAIEGINLEIMDMEDEKNDHIMKQEAALASFIQDSYGDVVNAINIERRAIEDLEDAALIYAVDFAQANLDLITSQEHFNDLLRDAEKTVWNEIYALERANELIYSPALTEAQREWEKIKNHIVEMNVIMSSDDFKNGLSWYRALQTAGGGIPSAETITGRLTEREQYKETEAFYGPGGVGRRSTEETYAKVGRKEFRKILRRAGYTSREADAIMDLLEGKGGPGLGLPKLQHGGTVSGPSTGYPVMLHGTEKVTPVGHDEISGETNITVNMYINEMADFETPSKRAKIIEKFMEELNKRMRR